jgi:hypothetical protein
LTISVKLFYAPVIVGAFLFSGCFSASYPQQETPVSVAIPSNQAAVLLPKWVYEPSQDGKIGGVGISKPHFKGKTAQRMLAISRALDEIARQMGVEIVSLQKITTSGTSQNAKTDLESYSFQTASGRVVRAKIESFWEDTSTDELYVWMVVE